MTRIVACDLNDPRLDPRIIDLLRLHWSTARAHTSPGSAHALDLASMRAPNVSFWTIWGRDNDGEGNHAHEDDDGALLGCGALKRLSADHGEIKSMHVVESARRRGVGAAMLRHIIAAARASGMSRLSLETGSWDFFHSARELYRRHGFVECAPFNGYVADPNNVFMSLDLRES